MVLVLGGREGERESPLFVCGRQVAIGDYVKKKAVMWEHHHLFFFKFGIVMIHVCHRIIQPLGQNWLGNK